VQYSDGYGNRSTQESKFDFLATRQCLVKNDEGQQSFIFCYPSSKVRSFGLKILDPPEKSMWS